MYVTYTKSYLGSNWRLANVKQHLESLETLNNFAWIFRITTPFTSIDYWLSGLIMLLRRQIASDPCDLYISTTGFQILATL